MRPSKQAHSPFVNLERFLKVFVILLELSVIDTYNDSNGDVVTPVGDTTYKSAESPLSNRSSYRKQLSSCPNTTTWTDNFPCACVHTKFLAINLSQSAAKCHSRTLLDSWACTVPASAPLYWPTARLEISNAWSRTNDNHFPLFQRSPLTCLLFFCWISISIHEHHTDANSSALRNSTFTAFSYTARAFAISLPVLM